MQLDDVVTNTVGALLGWAVWRAVRRWRESHVQD